MACSFALKEGLRLANKRSTLRGTVVRHFNTTSQNMESEGFLSKLFVRKIEPTKESHSTMLAPDKEIIYELQTHQVKPALLDNYLENYVKHTRLMNELRTGKHVGSWVVAVGDQDQVVHLWKYTGGYASIDSVMEKLDNNDDHKKLQQERLGFLRMRHSQYVLPFSFWPKIQNREGKNIYEVRSYILKPGTMIEWGNNWARAISFRQENKECFAGFFSQMGRLYNVHHFWCYKDFETRKTTRESAWRKPGWDTCVAYTVPLIREMESRILLPTSFSPTQ